MIKKNCLICGNEFIARNNQEKYCKDLHIVKCIICGEDILLDTNLKKSSYIKNQKYKTCSQKCAKISMMNTNKERYGFKTPFSNPKIRLKIEEKQQTDEYHNKLSKAISKSKTKITKEQQDIITHKIEQTKLLKYGNKHFTNTNKRLKTMQERYGVKYTAQSSELLEKMQNTCLSHYGVKIPAKSSEICKKISNSHKNRTEQQRLLSISKAKQTYYNKTGYDWFSQKHLCKETLNIIHNRNLFLDYILNIEESKRTIKYISDNLGLSFSYTYYLIKNYKLDDELSINYYMSSIEIEVQNFLKSLNINFLVKDRKILYPCELDIYIPDKNLALEINGTYYHSNKFHDSKYHYNKSNLCEEKNIRLIHIWEYEWYNDRQRPILENIIKNALGINENKLYARKLDIEVRSSNIMREFFDKNNIQGFRGR